MASGKAIKNRIKSVKNTKKITKAMELVAASKMKRAVASTLASRLYAGYSWDVLMSVAENMEKITHPLFKRPDRNAGGKEGEEAGRERVLAILVTSNRGLCGAYNAQAIKKALSVLKIKGDADIDFMTIGKKGDVAMRRVGQNIIASFVELPDNLSLSAIVPISKIAIGEYSSLRYDRIIMIYTDFLSPLTQRPNVKQILPISKESLEELIDSLGEEGKEAKISDNKEKKTDYLVEGDPDRFLGTLAEKLTRMQIFQMLLESNASEQSARMMAMKNASEASSEMIDDLTLMFNKERQANITREISEISAGMASIN